MLRQKRDEYCPFPTREFNAIVRAMQIIAHRGASASAPENTVAALRQAWREGADGAEFDLRLTRDRRIVVIHDDRTLRTTGRDVFVEQLSLREICELDAGSWKGSEWRGERIPDLRTLVAAAPPGKQLFIELKCGPEALPELREVLQGRSGVSFVGFSLETMGQVKAAFPDGKVFWNVEYAGAVDRLIDDARRTGLDGLGLSDGPAVDESVLRSVHDAGLQLFAWTVDDADRAIRHRSWGTEFLATNAPRRIIDALKAGRI